MWGPPSGGPDLLQFLDRAFQRPLAAAHVVPEIADLLDPRGHVPQRKRLRSDLAADQLLPGARRRYGRARLCADRVGGGERGAVAVAPRIDENPPAPIFLVELLRQLARIPLHERP